MLKTKTSRGPIKRAARTATARRGARVSPLYHQVYILLRDLLLAGELDPARPLPSEPALARQYDVSRVTIRKTLERLEQEALIRRVRGVGTFPTVRPQPADRANISGFLESLVSYDRSTTAVNLDWQEVEPEGPVLKAFGVGLCLRVVRVRSHRGRPISLTTIHVPARYKHLPEQGDNADVPIIQVLERHGIVAERTEQVMTAVAAEPLASEKLGVAPGSPLISMRRLMLDRDRAPVIHQESLYAPDRFEYRITLTRTDVGPVARWTPIS